MDISERLENNQTRMATYLAELLVLNYGTHVITSVDAGATLIQEDHIRSSFLQDSQSSHSAVTSSAGITFLNIVNFKLEESYISQNDFTKNYLSNRTNSRVQSIGGLPLPRHHPPSLAAGHHQPPGGRGPCWPASAFLHQPRQAA